MSNGWLPIETAPKDGTEIVLYRAGWHFLPVAVWMEYPGNPVQDDYGNDFWMDGWGFEPELCLGNEEGWLGWGGDPEPTHWMPLPKPPEAAA